MFYCFAPERHYIFIDRNLFHPCTEHVGEIPFQINTGTMTPLSRTERK